MAAGADIGWPESRCGPGIMIRSGGAVPASPASYGTAAVLCIAIALAKPETFVESKGTGEISNEYAARSRAHANDTAETVWHATRNSIELQLQSIIEFRFETGMPWN